MIIPPFNNLFLFLLLSNTLLGLLESYCWKEWNLSLHHEKTWSSLVVISTYCLLRQPCVCQTIHLWEVCFVPCSTQLQTQHYSWFIFLLKHSQGKESIVRWKLLKPKGQHNRAFKPGFLSCVRAAFSFWRGTVFILSSHWIWWALTVHTFLDKWSKTKLKHHVLLSEQY